MRKKHTGPLKLARGGSGVDRGQRRGRAGQQATADRRQWDKRLAERYRIRQITMFSTRREELPLTLSGANIHTGGDREWERGSGGAGGEEERQTSQIGAGPCFYCLAWLFGCCGEGELACDQVCMKIQFACMRCSVRCHSHWPKARGCEVRRAADERRSGGAEERAGNT